MPSVTEGRLQSYLPLVPRKKLFLPGSLLQSARCLNRTEQRAWILRARPGLCSFKGWVDCLADFYKLSEAHDQLNGAPFPWSRTTLSPNLTWPDKRRSPQS